MSIVRMHGGREKSINTVNIGPTCLAHEFLNVCVVMGPLLLDHTWDPGWVVTVNLAGSQRAVLRAGAGCLPYPEPWTESTVPRPLQSRSGGGGCLSTLQHRLGWSRAIEVETELGVEAGFILAERARAEGVPLVLLPAPARHRGDSRYLHPGATSGGCIVGR
jgi:hypothetical protein